jgi:uncharacterized protein
VTVLRDLQRQFFNALTGADLPASVLNGRRAALGLAVYRNNFTVGNRQALGVDYPVTASLVGMSCFAVLAHDYRLAFPSRSSDLHHLCAHFADFLTIRYHDGPHAYLADVARLERAVDECLLAAEAPVCAIAALAGHSPEALQAARLVIHPATRLVCSRWPIVELWDAHSGEGGPAPVDLASGGAAVVVQRTDKDVTLRTVDAPTYVLLQSLGHGASLGDAFAQAFTGESREVAARALARIFAWGLVTTVDVSPPCTTTGALP